MNVLTIGKHRVILEHEIVGPGETLHFDLFTRSTDRQGRSTGATDWRLPCECISEWQSPGGRAELSLISVGRKAYQVKTDRDSSPLPEE
jgi:hypothetical protein